jgi:hypothetical protein
MLHDHRKVDKERKKKEPRSHEKEKTSDYQTISFSFKSDTKPAPNQISLKRKPHLAD